jgi:hypothetical protein
VSSPTEHEETSGGQDLVADLTRWLAEQRVDAASAARAREHWLRQAAEEESLLAGVLLDLAEQGDTIVMQGISGRTHRGQVRGVGVDFLALRTGTVEVLLPYDAVVTIRPWDHQPQGATRTEALEMHLSDALAVIATGRPRVLVVSRDGTSLAGELRSVGRDLVTLKLAGAAGVAYVPMASIAEVTLAETG